MTFEKPQKLDIRDSRIHEKKNDKSRQKYVILLNILCVCSNGSYWGTRGRPFNYFG